MRASAVETIFLIFTLLSYLLILAVPFIIGKRLKKNNYLTLLFWSFLVTFILSIISVYWSDDLSEDIIYKLYGFDTWGMSDSERWTRELNPEDKKTIEKIYNGSFGIGWPLKLIMSYIFFMVPYNVIICGLIYVWKRKKAPNNV